MKRLLTFAVLIYLLTGLYAQQQNWHVYRSGGYPSDLVYRNSELWVSSSAGIMRWNPLTNQRIQYNVNNAPAQLASIYNLCVCQNGDVWGVGYYGAVRFNGQNWDYFDSTNSPLPAQTIREVVEDHNGAVWLTSNIGIYRYFNGSWTVFDSSNSSLPVSMQLHALAIDPQNRIWVGSDNGTWCYNGTLWTHYTVANSTLPNDTIFCIAFEANGTGWFGNINGVAKYANGNWVQNATLNGVSLSQLKGIYIDAWQRVWLWNYNNLVCWNGISYQHYPRTMFADYTLYFKLMVLDDNQNIWLGLFDTYSPLSLIKFDGVNITRYPICELPLPSKYVQSIFIGFDNKLWIGTSHGDGIGGYLSLLGDQVEAFGMYNTDMPCDHVWSLAQDELLNMWMGTCIGLLKTGPEGSVLFNSNETSVGTGNVQTICPVGNDGVWIGTNTGVSRYTNGTWSVLSAAEAGISLAGTKSIKQDSSGRIWIGSTAGVCTYFEGQFTVYPQLTNAKDFAFGMDGTVWVARGELSYLQNGVWNHYNMSNSGLLSNNVFSVAVDLYNVVWAGTSQTGCNLYRLADGFWRVYNSSNSVISGNQIKTILVDEDNTKWIGGPDLIVFNENGIPVETQDLFVPKPAVISNYPNPFTGLTNISYDKTSPGTASVTVYNLKGQQVWEYRDSGSAQGKKEISWNGTDKNNRPCAAGVYLIRVSEENRNSYHKILKLK